MMGKEESWTSLPWDFSLHHEPRVGSSHISTASALQPERVWSHCGGSLTRKGALSLTQQEPGGSLVDLQQ